ncbi:MAG: DUF2200 family protein [Rectinemataceae bacterium]
MEINLRKAERKGRTKGEVDAIITWLTGYDDKAIDDRVRDGSDFEGFFRQAPCFNENSSKITGMICGYPVEEITDDIIRKVRCLDKLIDELAMGKAMDGILRK